MPDLSQALKLKAEGNGLFLKKDFPAAYNKYTEAIAHDAENAILYSNRAACSLSLNRYLDAHTNATKATELDPSHVKSWARLASACTGLGKHGSAVVAWERALTVFPSETLSEEQRKQKDRYAAELATAVARVRAPPTTATGNYVVQTQNQEENLPWNRAIAIAHRAQSDLLWNTSAWPIIAAYQDWSTAVNDMFKVESYRTPAGMNYFGRVGVIEQLTNAITEDTRGFEIRGGQAFFEQYNRQALFEMTKTQAWADASAQGVMEDAPRRLASQGWRAVRPALSMTVRGWIMRAFIQDSLTDDTDAALDFYASAMEVLRWGIARWPDVPIKDKGAIFQESFLRSVKCLRLDALMRAYAKNPGSASKYPLSEILAGAKDLIKQLACAPKEPADLSYASFLCFTRYPLAQAHWLLGFYHQHTAKNIRNTKGPASEVDEHFKTSAKAYVDAADVYPPDDERGIMCLCWVVEALLETGIPAGELLALLNRMHDALPAMRAIWAHSADALAGRDTLITKAMDLRGRLQRSIDQGNTVVDTVISHNTTI
ncbi:hypothetical protein C8Q78DRAFT_464630 [Trametes maxima]|nr:hypothetical protein C8Q78DRAFT_464630 [Trametes maxima]